MNLAWNVAVPTAAGVAKKRARPSTTVTVPTAAAPSKNWTVPAGVAGPDTVAVSRTERPRLMTRSDVSSAVVVAAGAAGPVRVVFCVSYSSVRLLPRRTWLSHTPTRRSTVPVNPATGVSVTCPVAWLMPTVTDAGAFDMSPSAVAVPGVPTPNVMVSVASRLVYGRVNETGCPAATVWFATAPRNAASFLVNATAFSVNRSTAGAPTPSSAVTWMFADPVNPACGVSLMTLFTASVNTVAFVIVTG